MAERSLINQIQTTFARNAERVFLIESMTGRSWTFGEFYVWSCRAASLLSREGIKKGDRVALILANSAEFAALYFGCLFIGAIAVPINQALHVDEVRFILEQSRARLLLFSRCTRPLVLKASENVTALRQLRVSLGQEVSFHPEDAEEAWDYDSAQIAADCRPFSDMDDRDTALILYTSGTSGRPKGVAHSIYSEFGNAASFNSIMNFGSENRFLHIWPMAYSSGYLNVLMSPFLAGSSVVLSCAFNAQTVLSFWKPIVEHGANTLWLSPTMMASLVRMDRDPVGTTYAPTGIRTVCVGTAPLATKLKKNFESKYGVECHESYGLSELLIISTNVPDLKQPDSSVGVLLPDVEFKTQDDSGDPLPLHSEGEILIRTPFRMSGYLDENGNIVSAETTSWFATGDIGLGDSSGCIFITGRKKDLIIRGGQNLSPRAIRERLLEHPSVDDASVVGLPHEFYGEEVAAALRLKPGLLLEDEQPSILEYCRRYLAPAAVPTRLKQFAEFPVGSTGKTLDREIKNSFLTGK